MSNNQDIYSKTIENTLFGRLIRIRMMIPEAALYEQLAEECCELAQACSKKARKLRNENYTPKSMSEIDGDLIEEYTDVYLSALVCNIKMDYDILNTKLDRWIERNSERNGQDCN